MIDKETSSATGRRKDADGYKLNECGKVKLSFLNTEKDITTALHQVSDSMTEVSGIFFTILRPIDTTCHSSVKILKWTAMLNRLQGFRNKEFYLLKIPSRCCDSDRPYNHVKTDVLHQNKLDVAVTSCFVKIIDPPTSSSSPKYHCLGAKHIL
jgi:hypothetical protein